MKLGLFFLAVLTFSAMTRNGGEASSCPQQGPPGQPGIPGTPGTPGIPGTMGTFGSFMECSCCDRQNRVRRLYTAPLRRWKQCSWTFPQGKDDRDSGKVHECDFVKKRTDSYLRVVYMGNLRITSCTDCCKRWYFTFNDVECKTPAPIDGSLFHKVNINIHRPANIEGYCGGIPVGKVKVALNIGSCGGGNLKGGNAHTGWNQSSRIIIEEVEPPVA